MYERTGLTNINLFMPTFEIHHIAISAKDLERSAAFYKDLFGAIEIQRFERKDFKAKAVFLKLGSISLEIWEFEEGRKPQDELSDLGVFGIRHLAFAVQNLNALYQELKGKVEIPETKLGASGRRYAFIKDPDGIPIEFYEVNE